MTKQVLMTDEGLKNLEAELEELKAVKRKEKLLCLLVIYPKIASTMRLKMSKPSLKLESLLLKICLKM